LLIHSWWKKPYPAFRALLVFVKCSTPISRKAVLHHESAKAPFIHLGRVARDYYASSLLTIASLHVHVESASIVAYADEGKLREVVGNLVDNAIKYTKDGSVQPYLRHLLSGCLFLPTPRRT
jgi:hypothetical protein